MSRYVWLLDSGHGGMVSGAYQTAGKRSPVWSDGSQLFEGVFNRKVVKTIANLLRLNNIEYRILVPEELDVSLADRVSRANKFNKELNGKCILVSVHGNAGGGTGYEVFTTPGKTKSDSIATEFFNKAKAEFPEMKMRGDLSDGDPDKEEQLYILKNTSMPSILTENFFMDNENDCKLMMSDKGVERIAKAHVDAILSIEKSLI